MQVDKCDRGMRSLLGSIDNSDIELAWLLWLRNLIFGRPDTVYSSNPVNKRFQHQRDPALNFRQRVHNTRATSEGWWQFQVITSFQCSVSTIFYKHKLN